MWRSEGNLWEVILSSHSVDLGMELGVKFGSRCLLPALPAPYSAFFNLTVQKLQPPGGFSPYLSQAKSLPRDLCTDSLCLVCFSSEPCVATLTGGSWLKHCLPESAFLETPWTTLKSHLPVSWS